MAYIPPDGNSIVLDLTGTYLVPAGDAVVLDLLSTDFITDNL